MKKNFDPGFDPASSAKQMQMSVKPSAKAKVRLVVTATMKRRALKPKKSKPEKS